MIYKIHINMAIGIGIILQLRQIQNGKMAEFGVQLYT